LVFIVAVHIRDTVILVGRIGFQVVHDD
jgi:hypothetical protein